MISNLTTPDAVSIAWSVMFLVGAFLAGGKFRLGQILRYYIFQSLCLVGLMLSLAEVADWHAYLSAASVLVFRAVLMPGLLMLTANQSGASGRLLSFVRPAPSYFVSGVALLAAVLTGIAITPHLPQANIMLVVTAFAGIYMGLVMAAIRRDTYSQVIGFLTFVNGITILAVTTVGGWSILEELGMFVTVLLAVLLFSLLSRKLKELYAVEDTGILKELVD
ncbi:MAG: hypothetical protein WAZ14_03520 [Patescibacteria group bacterium]